METISLRKCCNLHLKIHYVKDFFVTFFLFFFRERKRKETNQRKQKESPWEVGCGTQKIRSKSTSEFWGQVTAENAPASAFLVLNLRITDEKARKVCYVSRKSGLKSQADRSVWKADSAGRLDCYVSSNKAMGIGFQRKGTESQPPFSFGRPFGSFPAMRKGT